MVYPPRFRFLRIHIAHVAPPQPLAVALGQSAHRVHQRRPCPHQSRSRFRTAMFHRTQQLRIDPGQPRRRLRVHAIIFLPALANQARAPRMRHDYLVPQLVQQPTYPGLVHPRFQRDAAPRHAAEPFLHRLGVMLTRCSISMLPASSNTQYQLERSPKSRPTVSFGSEIFLICFAAPVLIDVPCGVTRDSLAELYHENVCRHFRDCPGIARPNWPDVQRLETAPCCHRFRLEAPTLPLDRFPALCPSEQPLAIAPVFVERSPPDVHRQRNFVFHKPHLIQ